MSSDTKTGLLAFGIAAGTLYLLLKVFAKKEEDASKGPEITQEGIDTAVNAYQDAVASGEDLQTLNELNQELLRQYGVTVGINKEGKVLVSNSDNKVIRSL